MESSIETTHDQLTEDIELLPYNNVSKTKQLEKDIHSLNLLVSDIDVLIQEQQKNINQSNILINSIKNNTQAANNEIKTIPFYSRAIPILVSVSSITGLILGFNPVVCTFIGTGSLYFLIK